ncbi:MAG: hypothetical protein KAQ69_11575, partial [Spirochaetales bacterium]|nr:hypothetical protein [Spirochaetales bacterium]
DESKAKTQLLGNNRAIGLMGLYRVIEPNRAVLKNKHKHKHKNQRKDQRKTYFSKELTDE